MNYVFIDLDCTLIDTRDLVISGGPEPEPGTPEHEAWVAKITTPEVLAKAGAIPAVQALVTSLRYGAKKLFFLTNRRERMRTLTQRWLYDNKLGGTELLMRPDTLLTRAGQFKAELIESMIEPGDTVLIIDDDPDGSIEAEWKKRPGWTHLKITTY